MKATHWKVSIEGSRVTHFLGHLENGLVHYQSTVGLKMVDKPDGWGEVSEQAVYESGAVIQNGKVTLERFK